MALPLLALSIDVNGVGTVLPSVQDTFDVASEQLAWVINASTLAFAAVLVPVGRVVPRVGATRLLLAGVVGFGLMSLLAGLAPSFPVLVGARVGQGLASALCFTTSLAVVDEVFDERRRATAIGVWGAVSGVGGAIGPLVGGALTSWWSWRGFFLVNVPLCLVAVPVIAVLAPRDRTPTEAVASHRWGRVVALSASIVLVIGGLQAGSTAGWTDPAVLAALAAGIALLAGIWRARHDGGPVVSRDVTGAPLFRLAAAVAFGSTWGFGVVVLVMGIYLQQGLGLDPLDAGLAFASFSAAFALAGVASGRLTARIGVTGTMAVAMGVAAMAFGLLVWAVGTGGLAPVVVGLLVGGFGQGLAFDASTTASLLDVPDDAAAEASGVVQTLRLVGLSTGVAVTTTVAGAAATLPTGDLRATLALSGAVAVVALAACTLRQRRGRPGTVVP